MPRGLLSNLIGSAAGHVAEYNADRKERKAAEQTQAARPGERSSDETSSDDDDELNEEELQSLDEAQQTQVTKDEDSAKQPEDQQLLDTFLSRHPPPPYTEQSTSRPTLSMPVMLPQKRPGASQRGFIRAYAPILEEVSIDQNAWLDFLTGLDKSISNNSYLQAVNVAIMGLQIAEVATSGFSIITHAAVAALTAGVDASRKGYMNYARNRYLDGMNERFFKPRGLFCLIISYKPSSSSSSAIEDVDMSKTIEARDGQNKFKNLTNTSAATMTNPASMPQPAPLIFPQLDSMSPESKTNAIKQFGNSISDYHDRQERAKYAARNPDLDMQVQDKPFASVYSDPNSSARTGGLIGLATAGKVNPRARRQEARDERRVAKGKAPRAPRGERRRERKENRPIKRLLKEGALYLMVVNLPSEREIEAVRREMDSSAANRA